eukprot:m.6186 g.6186  ORF g.6186 m.6186 type:complete len:331 (-) comp2568_c0_seq2:3847-4839(-)
MAWPSIAARFLIGRKIAHGKDGAGGVFDGDLGVGKVWEPTFVALDVLVLSVRGKNTVRVGCRAKSKPWPLHQGFGVGTVPTTATASKKNAARVQHERVELLRAVRGARATFEPSKLPQLRRLEVLEVVKAARGQPVPKPVFVLVLVVLVRVASGLASAASQAIRALAVIAAVVKGRGRATIAAWPTASCSCASAALPSRQPRQQPGTPPPLLASSLACRAQDTGNGLRRSLQAHGMVAVSATEHGQPLPTLTPAATSPLRRGQRLAAQPAVSGHGTEALLCCLYALKHGDVHIVGENFVGGGQQQRLVAVRLHHADDEISHVAKAVACLA